MQRSMPRVALCSVISVAAIVTGGVSPSARQATGSISGSVVGEYAGEAKVYAKRIAPEPERVANVGSDGRFTMSGLAEGEYEVLILGPGSPAAVHERVRVGRGDTGLDPVRFGYTVTCECSYSIGGGGIVLSHHDATGNRLLRSYVRADPASDDVVDAELGPTAVCLCGRDPKKMGRGDVIHLTPGAYTLRGAAAGYESWVREGVAVLKGKWTDLDVTWTPRADAGADRAAESMLRAGESLARVETNAMTFYVAIDGSLAGRRLLTDAGRHLFDAAAFVPAADLLDPAPLRPPDRTDLQAGPLVLFTNALDRLDTTQERYPQRVPYAVHLALGSGRAPVPELQIDDKPVGRVLTGADPLRSWNPKHPLVVMAVTPVSALTPVPAPRP